MSKHTNKGKQKKKKEKWLIDYKGKLNIYTCPKNHDTVTVDREDGTTPFMIDCPKCKESNTAKSCFYKCPQYFRPEFEWYKPNIKNVKDYEKEHVEMGGLLMREIAYKTLTKGQQPSMTLLVEDLEKLNNHKKYKLLIQMARSGCFHDYKHDRFVGSPIQKASGPKMGFVKWIDVQYPELKEIRQKLIDGIYDDKADEEDLAYMRSYTPKNMWGMIGLNKNK